MPYNILTCSGFAETQAGWVASSACLKARIGMIILFFITIFLRKWGGEELGINFNLIFSLLIGMVAYFIIISVFGNFKLAMGIGVLGMLFGGYGIGLFTGEGGDY